MSTLVGQWKIDLNGDIEELEDGAILKTEPNMDCFEFNLYFVRLLYKGITKKRIKVVRIEFFEYMKIKGSKKKILKKVKEKIIKEIPSDLINKANGIDSVMEKVDWLEFDLNSKVP